MRPSASARVERGLVDDAAARGVDHDRGRLHQRERGGVDEVARRRVQVDVQRHDVGAREPVGERRDALDAGHRRKLGAQVERAHRHLRGQRARRDLLADAAEADEQQVLAAHVGSEELRAPHAARHVVGRLAEPARGHRDQRDA